MRVTVEKTTERPIIIAVRDDGVSLRVRTPDRKFSPPHDLILRSATMPSRSTAVTDISMIFLWNGFIGMSVFAKSMRTRAEAANNSVSVRTQLAEGLPPVQGDRVQLQQVVLNLIINAIEAMRDIGEEERELL